MRSEGEKKQSIRNNPANIKIREKGRKTRTPGAGAHSPVAYVAMLVQIFTPQPTEDPVLEQVLS